jgi:hypothetical protein
MSDKQLTEFDALEWIDHYFDGRANVDFDRLRPILCFSLIWNLFETVACHRRANPNTIRRSVDHADQSGRLDRGKYLQYLDYFRRRYLRNGSLEDAFDRLLMTDPTSQNVVRRAIMGEIQDLNNLVHALLLIAHRIRNNLFHGNKSIENLHTQTELFQIINHLLCDYMDDIEPLASRRLQ